MGILPKEVEEQSHIDSLCLHVQGDLLCLADYKAEIPKTVDALLERYIKRMREVEGVLVQPEYVTSGGLRMEVIERFLCPTDYFIPLGPLRDTEICVWHNDDIYSLHKLWEFQHNGDPRVTRAERDVRWHGAHYKYDKPMSLVEVTPELAHDYCEHHKILSLEQKVFDAAMCKSPFSIKGKLSSILNPD